MARLLSGRSGELLSSAQLCGSMPSTNRFGSKPGLETKASTPPGAGSMPTRAPRRSRAAERADAAPGGVDLDLLETRGAVQLLLVARLQPRLADEIGAAVVGLDPEFGGLFLVLLVESA